MKIRHLHRPAPIPLQIPYACWIDFDSPLRRSDSSRHGALQAKTRCSCYYSLALRSSLDGHASCDPS